LYSHESAKAGKAEKAARPPLRSGPTLPAHQQGLLGLQRAVGNAAVVQRLRQSGHSWAQPEQHQHSAGCGHQNEPPAEQRSADHDVQRSADHDVQRSADHDVQRSAVHDVLSSAGSPLDHATRTDMEARLGADFSDVRVHQDSQARASAAEIGARAYTSGNHVVIGEGGGDKHTLAHELTHVIQQRQGPVAGTDNGQGLSVSDPSDRFEHEAEANATRVMGGGTALPQQTEAPAESGDRSVEGPIQRRVSLRNPQDPRDTRDLGNVKSVRAFLDEHHISILESVKARMGEHASLGVTAAVRLELKATSVIEEFVADEKDRVYENSKTGARKLADFICDHLIKFFAASREQAGPAAAGGAFPRQTNQRQASGGGPGLSQGGPGQSSGGAGHGPLTDVLSEMARQKMREHTPQNPLLTGMGKGAASAVTGRVEALIDPQLPSAESVTEGMRWAAWIALVGESEARRRLETAAAHLSPEENQRLLAQFDHTLDAKTKEAAGTVLGSAGTGVMIGQAANFIPHPGARAIAKVGSTILGGLAAARKVGDGADTVKKIAGVSPEILTKLSTARDHDLGKAADDLIASSRKNTMEQMRDFGPFS
jgi:hypothetical protein